MTYAERTYVSNVPSMASSYARMLDYIIGNIIDDSNDNFDSWSQIAYLINICANAYKRQCVEVEMQIDQIKNDPLIDGPEEEYQIESLDIILVNAQAELARLNTLEHIMTNETMIDADKEYYVRSIWEFRGI